MPFPSIWRRWTGWGRGAPPQVLCPGGRGAGKALSGRGRTRPLYGRHVSRIRDFHRHLTAVASAAGALYQAFGIDYGWLSRVEWGIFGRFMRFTSLVVELIRARPRLVVWLVVLLQAAIWLILPLLLYRSPPGDLATVLAFGREYQVGTDLGPPLAFWLADIAFRAVGNHVFGVYLLAQICNVTALLDVLSAGARHRRRAAGGARGAAHHDGYRLRFARRRIRPAGAGASALGAVAAAYLATDRPEPAQRLVRVVDRGGPAAADDVGCAGTAAAGRGICARHRARPPHADVVRSAAMRCW